MTGSQSTNKELGYAVKKDGMYLRLTTEGLVYWVRDWTIGTLFDKDGALRILKYFDEKDTKVEKVVDKS